jgi:hypothetical protein
VFVNTHKTAILVPGEEEKVDIMRIGRHSDFFENLLIKFFTEAGSSREEETSDQRKGDKIQEDKENN